MAKLLIGIRVEYTTYRLQGGVKSVLVDCEDDPIDCCLCCSPMPPSTLWAVFTSIGTGSPGCDCLPTCITLTYDPVTNAWYTINLEVYCTIVSYMRLRCVLIGGIATWVVDFIDSLSDTYLVLSTAILTLSTCDPFIVVTSLTDTDAPCIGDFTVSISGTNCSESADCCPGYEIPDNLWVTISNDIEGCACLPACILLVYDEERDAWYSSNLSAYCGGADTYFKLYCVIVEGIPVWFFDVVDEDDVVIESGAVDQDNATCDPIGLDIAFIDVDWPCEGSFNATIAETDCTPAPILTGCCVNTIPSTLFATFSGTDSCDCLSGTVAITYNALTEKWEGSGTLCNVDVDLEFYCSDPQWQLDIISVHGQDGHSGPETICDPFVWSSTLILLNAQVCDIGGLVTISE